MGISGLDRMGGPAAVYFGTGINNSVRMLPLSARQTEVLEFLVQQTRVAGRPPSQTEIATHFGFRQNAARDHLLALATKGYIAVEPNSARGIRLLVESVGDQIIPPKSLPVLGRIAAGAPITAAPNIEEWVTIDPEMFRPAASCLSRVKGDSMVSAGIYNGDLVGIRFDSSAESGILAVGVPDQATGDFTLTLKTYRRRSGKVHLISENDDQDSYPPMIYAPHEIVVVGRYVGLFRMQAGP